MSDRFPAEITIGGDIKRSLIEGLIGAICGDGASLGWGEAPFEPKDEKELLEGFTSFLILKDEEARYGQFDEIEGFCRENGIAYDRHSDGYCEYDPENVSFRPGMDEPVVETTDRQGHVLVNGDDLASLINDFETNEWARDEMIAQLKTLLPKGVPALEKLRIVD